MTIKSERERRRERERPRKMPSPFLFLSLTLLPSRPNQMGLCNRYRSPFKWTGGQKARRINHMYDTFSPYLLSTISNFIWFFYTHLLFPSNKQKNLKYTFSSCTCMSTHDWSATEHISQRGSKCIWWQRCVEKIREWDEKQLWEIISKCSSRVDQRERVRRQKTARRSVRKISKGNTKNARKEMTLSFNVDDDGE